MLGPFATTSRLTPIHQMSLAVLSRAACASMSTTTSTTTTTTTTTRDRGNRCGPMEWAQLLRSGRQNVQKSYRPKYNTIQLKCAKYEQFIHVVYTNHKVYVDRLKANQHARYDPNSARALSTNCFCPSTRT